MIKYMQYVLVAVSYEIVVLFSFSGERFVVYDGVMICKLFCVPYGYSNKLEHG